MQIDLFLLLKYYVMWYFRIILNEMIHMNLKNLVKYGQIAMQLLQYNVYTFNVLNSKVCPPKIAEWFLMLQRYYSFFSLSSTIV